MFHFCPGQPTSRQPLQIHSGYVDVKAMLSHANSDSAAAMVSFAVLTVYMLFAAVFCILRAVHGFGDSSIFAQIIVSTISTYGCYVLSSFLALDPWHLGECFSNPFEL